jgi:multidrug efflux pump subunit AcrA (membrane-fusion protein)
MKARKATGKAQAAANMDQLTVKRYQKLFGTKYISQQDYDTAVATRSRATPPWSPRKPPLKPRASTWPTPK